MDYLNFYHDKKLFKVQLVRTTNRNMYLKLNRENALVCTAPLNVDVTVIKGFIAPKIPKFAHYLSQKILTKTPKELYFLGTQYELVPLIVMHKHEVQVRLEKSRIYLYVTKDDARFVDALVRKWLKQQFHIHITPLFRKIEYEIFQDSFHLLKLGSGNFVLGTNKPESKTITLSIKLIHMNWEQIQYVIYHEFTHDFALNHSPKFWEILHGFFPTYKSVKKSLSFYD